MSHQHLKHVSPQQMEALLILLKQRFIDNMARHHEMVWGNIQAKLIHNPEKLWSLMEMERTGGEPDVIGFDDSAGEYLFCDCSAESPKGRRSLCYDGDALDTRKEYKPAGSAMDMAKEMGIELLDEQQYRQLQNLGNFDLKTSSWLLTPPEIRKLGGALFGDRRYNHVFIYHNGAESYYAARGFRGMLKV